MNTQLYIGLGLVVAAGLLVVLLPLWRNRQEQGVGMSFGILLVLFPLSAALIYSQVNTYDWQQQFSAAETPAAGQEQVDVMIRELAARLRDNPDVEGWVLLGRSYAQLGQYQQAADAFYEAWVMTEGKAPAVAMDYAEALILVDQRSLVTSAGDLIEDVLKALPDDPRGLWYGGLSAAAKGDQKLAAERWARLLQLNIPENFRAVVQQQLAALNVDTEALVAESAEPATSIAVTVELAAELSGALAGNEPMFIIARDLDRPMPPVAVKRVRVGDFPVTINISDANVMIPGRKLGDVKNLALIARISKSGNAMQNPGDLFGEARPDFDDEGGGSAIVRISQQVPGD